MLGQKRKRFAGDGTGYNTMQRRAYFARKRFSELHPWVSHGAARVKRGSDYSLQAFGPSFKEATDLQKMNRRYTGFTGKGMYYGQGNYFKRMMHRQMNRTLAGKTPLGNLGKKIGRNLISRVEGAVLGQGSYDVPAVEANNLVAGGGLSVPSFVTSQDETGALTIQHSEYIKDIYGLPWSSGSLVDTFKNDSLHLNPGIANNFPWLSQIASNYEEYEFKQLMFCFKTRVGDNLTTTDGQVGTIMMFTDYNATDKPRRTKQDMLQAYGTSVAKITDNDVLHGIECDPSKIKGDAHKFIRVGASDEDLHDFDWGLFQIAVDNTPETLSNKVIGELYVSYTVVLRKPRLFATLGLSIQQDQFIIPYINNNSGSLVLGTVGAGHNNSIGSTLVAPASSSSDTASCYIVLPASLSGAIEVLVTLDSVTSSSSRVFIQPFSGNVALRRDLALGSTQAYGNDDSDPSSGISGDWSNAYALAVSSIGHFDVQMASKDEDNKIRLNIRNTTSTTSLKVHVQVRRYNNGELLTPPTFKDTNGQEVIMISG